MFRIGQLSILGIHASDFEDDIFTLLCSDEFFNRLESYHEWINRLPHTLLSPERAFALTYNVATGTETERLTQAAQAAAAATPVTPNPLG